MPKIDVGVDSRLLEELTKDGKEGATAIDDGVDCTETKRMGSRR
jgi:hypothetical protein